NFSKKISCLIPSASKRASGAIYYVAPHHRFTSQQSGHMDFLYGSPLTAFFTALIATLFATPVVRKIAWRADAVARPDARRVHPEPIAQWGGLAIFFGVALAALLWRQPTLADLRQLAASSTPSDIQEVRQTVHLTAAFFGCGFLMLLLGMADDRFEFRPHWKILGQILIVILLWSLGLKIQTLPFTSGTLQLSDPISLLFTLVWVVGLTNAINLDRKSTRLNS